MWTGCVLMFSQIRQAMKPTDFSKYLSGFLIGYLSHERGASKNTICAYRDTFVLFIAYMETQHVKVARLTLQTITQATVLLAFSIGCKENVGTATRHGMQDWLLFMPSLTTSNINIRNICMNVRRS